MKRVTNLSNAIAMLYWTRGLSTVGRATSLGVGSSAFADGAAIEEGEFASARGFPDYLQKLESRVVGGAHKAEIQPPRVVWSGDGDVLAA